MIVYIKRFFLMLSLLDEKNKTLRKLGLGPILGMW